MELATPTLRRAKSEPPPVCLPQPTSAALPQASSSSEGAACCTLSTNSGQEISQPPSPQLAAEPGAPTMAPPSLLSLVPDMQREVLGYLTYTELRALGATCSALRDVVDGFFYKLPLRFPDPDRSSALQLRKGLYFGGKRFLAALTYMLDKGAVLVTMGINHTLTGNEWRLLSKRGAPMLQELNIIHSTKLLGDKELSLAATVPKLQRLYIWDWEEGADLGKLMLAVAALPELRQFTIILNDEELPAKPFAVLQQMRSLESLELKIREARDPVGIIAQLPLLQLRELRLTFWVVDLEKVLVRTLPTLPGLEVLSLDGTKEDKEFRLPWERLPALRSLEGVFLLEDHEDPPTLRNLRRLQWNGNKEEHQAKLVRFLAATPMLSDLCLGASMPTQELITAVERLQGTMRRLEFTTRVIWRYGRSGFYGFFRRIRHYVDVNPSQESCNLRQIQLRMALIRALPGLTHLHINEEDSRPNIRHPVVFKRDWYFEAAAACPGLRQLTTTMRSEYIYGYDDAAAKLAEHRRAAGELLVRGVLGNPERAPGLPLHLLVFFHDDALGIAAAAAAADRRAAACLRVRWLWGGGKRRKIMGYLF